MSPLGGDHARAVDPADRLGGQDDVEPRPVAQRDEGADVRPGEHATAHEAAVARVERVEAGRQLNRPARCRAIEDVRREPRGDFGVRSPLVGLERQQVVGTLRSDLLGDVSPAGECVEAHQAAADVESVEQLRQRPWLAAFVVGGALREDEATLGRVRADEVQGRARALAVERVAHRLPVDGHLLGRLVDAGRRGGWECRAHPAEERLLERVRVHQGSTNMSTRRKVSCDGMPCDGMPCGSARKERSQRSLQRA